MARKCPDCSDKRIAFSTRKTIARFFYPILPFRAGRCVNCKRRRTHVNSVALIACLVGSFLILVYLSTVVTGLQRTQRQTGEKDAERLQALPGHRPDHVSSAVAREQKPALPAVKEARDVKEATLSGLVKNGPLKNDGLALNRQKVKQGDYDLEALRDNNETLSQYLAQQQELIAAKERQINELSSRLNALEQKALHTKTQNATDEAWIYPH